jgi:hypothetical protein
MNIKLNFVNSAQLAPTATPPTVLVFQKQQCLDGQVRAVVWKVIERCRHTNFHPFVFADSVSVSTGDKFGNYSELIPAVPGELFEIEADSTGRRHLQRANVGAASGTVVSIMNSLTDTSYHACLFVRGQLIAEHRSVPPGEQIDFVLDSSLWVAIARRGPEDDLVGQRLPGTARDVREGDYISQRVLEAATPINLLGVVSANIVMHGGENGFTFRREAVVSA